MRKPSSYAVHLLIQGGHREEVRFKTIQEFQAWYTKVLIPKHNDNEFLNVPIKTMEGEYLVVRPCSIMGVRVEPVFTTSIDRDEVDDLE
ncbi:hypothetical protein [Lyngbya sp. CCY1209]|uniref:hypothetical protein n=1 Tax=Lyngbya sp. CCY1209 TaxID=2886103 RepID=UPI002D204999|nr:hypothetical protein [Lyngbya sp. CCY1209]MEB3881979.1 hypothetical protein [Lyngbya sp. CCY1209]